MLPGLVKFPVNHFSSDKLCTFGLFELSACALSRILSYDWQQQNMVHYFSSILPKKVGNMSQHSEALQIIKDYRDLLLLLLF